MRRLHPAVLLVVGAMACVLTANTAQSVAAAEQEKSAKKPKAAPEAKAAKPKAEKPKFQTAETAAKPKACFGLAPKIEKLSPDEGKAGDRVTIRGTEFGSPECLRGVSFGPGHAANFTMKNDGIITAVVPKGGRKGLAMVTVTTASGEDSKAFLLK